MKTPRSLNGKTFADHLVREWDYKILQISGSHIVLRTETPHGQTVAVPAHKPVRAGTLDGILRAISLHKGVSKTRILLHLI